MGKAILVVLLMAAGGAFGKDNLAILPFTGGAGDEGETIAELFSFEPELTAVFNPIPRTSINRAIGNEQRFQLSSGMTDPDTAAALGKQLGAQYVVSGSITALGRQKLLVIAILQVDELRQIAGDVQTYGNIEEIEDKLPGMARNIGEAAKRDASKLPKLALPPVELSGDADKKDADTLAQILAVYLIRGGKYAVYPRTESLERIQEEYARQLSGDTEDEHLPDIGKGANPGLVLAVNARKLGTRNMFNAAVINLLTGVQEAGQRANYQGLDDGIRAMEELGIVLSGGKAPERAASETKAPSSGTVPVKKEEAPSAAAVPRGREWKAADQGAFKQAIGEIDRAAQDGAYTIILTGSFPADPVSFSGNAAKTITLRGEASVRIISNQGVKPLFIVPGKITLILDTNITLEGNNQKTPLVRVEGGALVMKDGSTLRGSANRGVYVDRNGSFTMSGGTISGNSVSGSHDGGGGVRVYDGSFTMSGGAISDNSADGYGGDGGGVYVDTNGSFTMSGGTISNNSARGSGGGVYVREGSFIMSGGTISNNSAVTGGGVYISGSSFTMSGGTISNNSARIRGGGVYVARNGSFTMSGGAISDNSAGNGGGVSVDTNGSFIMSGGAISDNWADGYGGNGGGVSVADGSVTMSGGTISGNSASNGGGGGVYVSGNGWFVKTSGTIDGTNRASRADRGRAVYSNGKVRNSPAGPEVTIDSRVSGRAGGWE
ncbi:hypothetical protein Holit_00042 [Hollandina sp. SP2]